MRPRNWWLVIAPVFIALLLLSPSLVMYRNILRLSAAIWLAKHFAINLLFFLVPVVLFYRNLKGYYFFLLPWVLLTPVFLYFNLYLDTKPTFSLIALLMQTNPEELLETSTSYLWLLLWVIAFGLVFHLLAKRFPYRRLPFKTAFCISAFAFLVGGLYLGIKVRNQSGQVYLVGYEFYPVSIITGIGEARSFIKQNNLEASRNFAFHAVNKDTACNRKLYVLVIGETSRYDHWSVNGYHRITDPLLRARKEVISFSNVSAGCNLTWMSVPQMITRATPDSMDLQFKEKSIISAFRDAGFKTAWISNQSDQEFFWSGSITLHAKTADYYNFPKPTTTTYNKDKYDDRVLPILDSLLHHNDSNLFLVVHTMGNHFPYYNRYPEKFNHFRPSGYDRKINPDNKKDKEFLINDYDNSIRYTDYILNEIISKVAVQNLESFVYYISDHGEDLYDRHKNKAVFHLVTSRSTLHVPLFFWASETYQKKYPRLFSNLVSHRDAAIGPEQTFYSLLHLAQISFPGFASEKSIASKIFMPSTQKAYDYNYKQAVNYAGLKP